MSAGLTCIILTSGWVVGQWWRADVANMPNTNLLITNYVWVAQSSSAGSVLGQRHRRWPSTEPTLKWWPVGSIRIRVVITELSASWLHHHKSTVEDPAVTYTPCRLWSLHLKISWKRYKLWPYLSFTYLRGWISKLYDFLWSLSWSDSSSI